MTATITPTRRLLARLSALMAERDLPLERVVTLIANEMVAEVCSAFALRGGEVLELCATHGLRAEAVGRTRLQVGEGIVGLCAATGAIFNLADAQTHPAFAARAETGEAAFASLLALPIRRAGATLGVLTVQNRLPRRYAEDEIEVLETVALLLGEAMARSSLVPLAASFAATLAQHFDCAPLSPGIAMGRLVLAGQIAAPARVLAEDVVAEQARLDAALRSMQSTLDTLIAGTLPIAASPEAAAMREVMEATRGLAGSQTWLRRAAAGIAGGLTAEAAVLRVLDELRNRLTHLADPYLRERLADFEDLAARLLDALNPGQAAQTDATGAILLARRIGPAELLAWHARGIAAVVAEEASNGGHAAILARALDLPMLGGARGVLAHALAGQAAVVDADSGLLVLRPEQPVQDAYETAIAARAARAASLAGLADAPCRTADGTEFALHINAGLLAEMAQLARTGADGVGLFRTEIAMMARGAVLPPEEQTQFYAKVMDAAGGRPVVFRTLDLGADKLLPDAGKPEEENPAMGWRSLRVGLDRPALLRRQLRALLLAAGGRPLAVMFPMVASLAEFVQARALLLAEAQRVRPEPQSLAIGLMLEVPALLFQLREIMREADFVSVGSNDLLQFLYAADRASPELAGRYDFLSPAMLDVLERIARRANVGRARLSICGEAAARPLEALVLLALGYRHLSMSAGALLDVKSRLLRADLSAFSQFLTRLRAQHRASASLREPIAAWARDHGLGPE